MLNLRFARFVKKEIMGTFIFRQGALVIHRSNVMVYSYVKSAGPAETCTL